MGKKYLNHEEEVRRYRKRQKILTVIGLTVVVGLIVASFFTEGTVDPETYEPAIYSTFVAVIPPLAAIILALITKEVYSSLFFGIIIGALLYANGNLELGLKTMLYAEDAGLISKLSDTWNMGILVFLILLGIIVALMNEAGGSEAFGHWASKRIKTRVGAQLATFFLGILIFVDDYFNCLTVGSVMRPITDRHQTSRAKLSYLIDATAAPVCIIAPVSSWAAAVTSSVPEEAGINGFSMFLRTIPYNFYALTTIVMILFITSRKLDYGPMKLHEKNALNGDLFTTMARPYGEPEDSDAPKERDMSKGKVGHVIDLVFPVVVLITCCIFGMVYTGGFFEGENFIDAFANADASQGLVYGSMTTLLISFAFYMIRGTLSFKRFMDCIAKGFRLMVAPVLILALAWTLSGMTGMLGLKEFVADLVGGSANSVQMFLPVILFLVALFLAFATGTSWGTFAILIPIVCHVFASPETAHMLAISIAACLAGAVCGDHCSPISDTTIMASAGAQCDHVNHVSTQLPYALTAAAVSAVGFLMAGIIGYTTESDVAMIALPVSLILMVVTLIVIEKVTKKKQTI
ncbi:MAG: Na+/H+ antiporter NhaC family protein [Eubacterium sp.]|nr:Na+/H+ antiporter NhaC family protein [Eubacterium sp.]